ncbi:MAG TPA: cation transporter [Kineosporiaceae bacterium]|nr:cation transporter [Kineosporiaceae bacterium]
MTSGLARTAASSTEAAPRANDVDEPPHDRDDEVLELVVGGMTCSSCAARVERTLNKLDGVHASVNYATECAVVTGLPRPRAGLAIAAVEKAGYSATLTSEDDAAWSRRATAARLTTLRRRLALAAILTVPLCDLTILLALAPGFRFPGWQLTCVLIALPVVTWAAWPFHRITLRNLRHGTTSMETLVSLGMTVSFGWALYTLFHSPDTQPATGWGSARRRPAPMRSTWTSLPA